MTTRAPRSKPQRVGGLVATAAEYEAMPIGAVIVEDHTYVRAAFNEPGPDGYRPYDYGYRYVSSFGNVHTLAYMTRDDRVCTIVYLPADA